MLSETLQNALNEQLNMELYSSYLYLSMASQFRDMNLTGFARWMEIQAMEEVYHAMKFYAFVNERGGRVQLAPVEGPVTSWDSPMAMFEDAYRHEQVVTSRINNLVDMAMEERDHATNIFLQWFVTEQVEEEASADEVVQKLKLMADAGGGLFMLDRELGQRVFKIPPEAVFMTAGAQ